MDLQVQETSFNSHYGEQYTITLEFELQREKEKNKILEERLRNKEMFIVEMKKMQTQMELLSEKWRLELVEEREKREVMEKVTLRECVETIAELEHKINLLEGNAPIKKAKIEQKIQRNQSQDRLRKFGEEIKVRQNAVRDKQETHDLLKNFVNRFMEMYGVYNNRENEEGLKRQLKRAWKWIKQVVKDWQEYQRELKSILQYAENCSRNGVDCEPHHILRLENSRNGNEDYNDNQI